MLGPGALDLMDHNLLSTVCLAFNTNSELKSNSINFLSKKLRWALVSFSFSFRYRHANRMSVSVSTRREFEWLRDENENFS